jgi:hypothetical protein
MGLKPETSDEIGGTSRPLVEVPRPLLEKVANILNVVVLAGVAAMLAWACIHLARVAPLLGPFAAVGLGVLLFFVLAEL